MTSSSCCPCRFSFTGNVGRDLATTAFSTSSATFNEISVCDFPVESICEAIELTDCGMEGETILCDPVREDCMFFFKTLVAGNDIVLTSSPTSVTISSTGECTGLNEITVGDGAGGVTCVAPSIANTYLCFDGGNVIWDSIVEPCTGLNEVTVGDGAGGVTCLAPTIADTYLCFDGANLIFDSIVEPCTGLDEVTIGDGAGGVTCLAPTDPDTYLCFDGNNIIWDVTSFTRGFLSFNGVIENWTSGANEFAEWGTGVSPGEVSTIVMPFSGTIIAFTASYISDSATSIGAGESVTIQVGTVTGAPPVVFTAFASTNIVWGVAEDGTFPTGSVTGTLGTIAAGDRLAARTVEVGSVTPSSAEVGVVVVIERS